MLDKELGDSLFSITVDRQPLFSSSQCRPTTC